MITATMLLALASLLGVSTASSISTTKVGGLIDLFYVPGPTITGTSIPTPTTVVFGHSPTHTREFHTVETDDRLEIDKPGQVFLSLPALVISRISEHAKTTTGEVARAVKTSNARLAVEKPDPVFVSVPGPVASRIFEHAKTKTEDVARAPASVAPIQPVEKSTPVITYVSEPTLSCACEARKTQTHNLARAIDCSASSTLHTSAYQSSSVPHLRKTRPIHSATITVIKRSEAGVPVVAQVTVDPATATLVAPPSFGTRVVQRDTTTRNKNNTSISPSTIGWIVAIIFGVLMTVVCVILLHTKMSDRRRNAAARRHFREI
jgi:hypothetical protein